MDMEEKIYYGSEKSMMVFDDISRIPRNAEGEIELSMLLVFVCCKGTVQLRVKERLYELGPSTRLSSSSAT